MDDLQNTEFEALGSRLFRIRLHGYFTPEEALAVFDVLTEHVRDEPYFLLEVDMSDLTGASPEARRISAEKLGPLPHRAIAIVSSNFAQRIIAKLVLTAVSILEKTNRNTTSYFATSEEAQEWLESKRGELDAKTKASPV